MQTLDFEKPLSELYNKIDELKRLSEEGNVDLSNEIEKIEERAEKLKKEVFSNLTPRQVLQIARHPNRPDSLGLAGLIFDEFLEIHGDRTFRDDPSIVGGPAKLGGFRVMFIGHQKGHDTKEKIYRNFGMPHPEGYRKALRLMEMADRFQMPIVTFVDTPGAFPGKEAEERGQAEAIARNLREMAGLKVPVITVVIGEGGSGGALGIAVSNKIYMMEYAVYSVISPEGCASILFRDSNKADYAAEKLKITAKDIVGLGVADAVLPEPLGGAHNNWPETATTIRTRIEKDLKAYKKKAPNTIMEERYAKFRAFGQFEERKEKA
ncbi:MAG: acetyl-CoA carboxylase carboxyltransferase subunit alpha [bacterium]|nr:acetyl-CoA carboxylase carboxyltransferase subunit alpha [bacterium]